MIKRKTEIVKKEESTVTAKQCDKCKTWFDVEKDWEDAQEFHHIRFTGGYGSIFGDGVHVQCDICQYCLKKMIEKFMICKDVE